MEVQWTARRCESWPVSWRNLASAYDDAAAMYGKTEGSYVSWGEGNLSWSPKGPTIDSDVLELRKAVTQLSIEPI